MNLQDIYDPLLKIGIAAGVSGLIGAEREYRNKSAGLKTIVLIGIGSTLFTILSMNIGTEPDRIMANIITGIGFLGAGVIFKDEGKVSGITTASTIWITAALGMCIGIGDYVLTTIMILAVLTVLLMFERLEDYIEKIHKVFTYSILAKKSEINSDNLQSMMRSGKLRIMNFKCLKREDKMLYHITASGHPKAHKKFLDEIIGNENVLEVTY